MGKELQQPPNSIIPNKIFQVRWTNHHLALHTSPPPSPKKIPSYNRTDATRKMPASPLLSTRSVSDSSPLPPLQPCAPKAWKRWPAALPPQGRLWWAAGGPAQPCLRHLARSRCREQSAPTKLLGSSQACGALLSLPLPSPSENTAFLASTLARRPCADCWPTITSSINRGFISSGIF